MRYQDLARAKELADKLDKIERIRKGNRIIVVSSQLGSSGDIEICLDLSETTAILQSLEGIYKEKLGNLGVTFTLA